MLLDVLFAASFGVIFVESIEWRDMIREKLNLYQQNKY